ncbi:alpha/beta fold hydrolase [Demetria terragena]|uniref:alpha/beta fold hydrolase n=1 Tax=Demetria terragena TaxID=63959 RepID=UPI00037D3AB3|nr:alpha/beta hydrolase [Demetria terragena]
MTEDVSSVLIDGPWNHRMVAANGARFHIAEAGTGGPDRPLVLLLHSFPEFWWAWRHQIPVLADAGYRVAAMDLRGYAASDKPPQGYDTFTLAADAAALVRCLGERRVVVVGHGWGGWIAWAMATMQPDVTTAVASFGMPHPLVMRQSSARVPAQVRANRYLHSMQMPFVPERQLVAGPRYTRRVMRAWSGSDWPAEDLVQRYAAALTLPFVAHSSAEYFRWIVRSVLRSDGRRFVNRLSQQSRLPTLFVHGEDDGCVLPASTLGSQTYCRGPYREVRLPGVGHFVPEQAPERTNELLLQWLATI